MDDLKKAIDEARANNYSDDEIVSFLAQHPVIGAKVQAAQKEGYNPKDIVEHVSGLKLGGTSAAAPAPAEKSLSGFGDNVMNSLFSTVGSTVMGIPSLAATAGDLVSSPSEAPGKLAAMGKGLWDTMKSRYGGVENIKKTAYDDPVGVLGDLSTVLTGAGGAARLAKLGTLTKALETGATLTNPLSAPVLATRGAAQIARKVAPEAMDSAARTWMDKALHVGGKAAGIPTKRTAILDTAMDNRLPVTPGGQAKMFDMMDALKAEKAQGIGNAGPIQVFPADIAHNAANWLSQNSAYYRAAPEKVKTITQTLYDLIDTPAGGARAPFRTMTELEDAKQANQQIAKKAFGTTVPGQEGEARKAIAASMADALEREAGKQGLTFSLPDGKKVDLAGINKELGGLAELKPQMIRGVNRNSRKEVISLLPTLGAVAGGAMHGGTPEALALGGLMKVLTSPMTKSQVAFLLKNPKALSDTSNLNQTLNVLNALGTVDNEK